MSLATRLCKLLAMDDVSPIIEYLASVTDDDVNEYLSSLLGLGSEVKAWSDDYLTARKSGTLSQALTSSSPSSSSQSPPKPSSNNAQKSQTASPAPVDTSSKSSKPAPPLPDKIMGVPVRRVKGVRMDPKTNSKKSFNKPPSKPPPPSSKPSPPSPSPPPPPPLIKITPLKTGHRTSPTCSCFGTLHPILTNCLSCGYLTCVVEGYDFCPYCKVEIREAEEGEGKEEKHKRRLLEFDRESAKRTVIFDDQADYFSNSSSTWLNDEEREEARAKDEGERKELHKRGRGGEINLGDILI
ncbi:hypothetical protein TrVE_jg11465 [Triparma verrucosa]|uniref:Zinc finger C2HC5-type domain-containing protein n=1 Tax=Triparma verrucosa TaxID=1606542 RepID=A0A9W7C9C6_9STRA|nr:hypothetical protein TrVE_jg11465 [Triparma verrucosa]